MYGPPQSCKSFLALDIAWSVGSGNQCLGMPVQPGPVLYLADQGFGGIQSRQLAWEISRGVKTSNVGIISDVVTIFDIDDVRKVERTVNAMGSVPVLIVIDTLSRSLGTGDENSARDTNLFMTNAISMRQLYACTVLMIHHPSHQNKGPRGSTAIGAAADTIINVQKTSDGISLNCEKQKDGEPFPEILLRVVNVPLTGGGASLVLAPKERDPGALTGSAERNCPANATECHARTMLQVLDDAPTDGI